MIDSELQPGSLTSSSAVLATAVQMLPDIFILPGQPTPTLSLLLCSRLRFLVTGYCITQYVFFIDYTSQLVIIIHTYFFLYFNICFSYNSGSLWRQKEDITSPWVIVIPSIIQNRFWMNECAKMNLINLYRIISNTNNVYAIRPNVTDQLEFRQAYRYHVWIILWASAC